MDISLLHIRTTLLSLVVIMHVMIGVNDISSINRTINVNGTATHFLWGMEVVQLRTKWRGIRQVRPDNMFESESYICWKSASYICLSIAYLFMHSC